MNLKDRLAPYTLYDEPERGNSVGPVVAVTLGLLVALALILIGLML